MLNSVSTVDAHKMWMIKKKKRLLIPFILAMPFVFILKEGTWNHRGIRQLQVPDINFTNRILQPDTPKPSEHQLPEITQPSDHHLKETSLEGLFSDIRPLFFEPAAHEDFPTTAEKVSKIPHIIHQTYKTGFVPESSAPLIESFVKFNPNWTYFFWTDKTARKFMEDKYKFFLPIWDGYKENVYRADALRYFVLHEYGGVYADIDVECLRPLDRATMKYPAIFPLEPFEHSVFRLRFPYLVNNAIMLTRPKHPFLGGMLHQLAKYVKGNSIIDVAGPMFVNKMFKEYYSISRTEEKSMVYDEKSKSQEPYFFKGTPKSNEDDMVYVPNTHFFMNTLADNFDVANAREACKTWRGGRRAHCIQQNRRRVCRYCTDLEKRACNELQRRDNRTLEDHFRFTFTRHHWFSTYYKSKILLNNTVDVRTIVPHARFYS